MISNFAAGGEGNTGDATGSVTDSLAFDGTAGFGVEVFGGKDFGTEDFDVEAFDVEVFADFLRSFFFSSPNVNEVRKNALGTSLTKLAEKAPNEIHTFHRGVGQCLDSHIDSGSPVGELTRAALHENSTVPP